VFGRWQGVFLIELDGPRERTVRVASLGEIGPSEKAQKK
jgi:thiamine phosphate synthase YjbQ (UPF0047 family)